MSFLANIAATMAAENAASTKVDAEKMIQERNRLLLVDILGKLGAIIAGAFKPQVDEATDTVLRFVRIGGLAEHEDLFARFFAERPDAFYVGSIPELFKSLLDAGREDLRDMVAKVYWDRAMSYDPAEEHASGLQFNWRVKGCLTALVVAGGDKQVVKYACNHMLRTYAGILGTEEYQQSRNLLLAVAETGNFILRTPNGGNTPTIQQGVAEKGDATPRKGIPSRKYAKLDETGTPAHFEKGHHNKASRHSKGGKAPAKVPAGLSALSAVRDSLPPGKVNGVVTAETVAFN